MATIAHGLGGAVAAIESADGEGAARGCGEDGTELARPHAIEQLTKEGVIHYVMIGVSARWIVVN